MAHPRKDIRDAIVATLKGTADPRPTSAGARIYGNRMEPLKQRETMPVVVVYALREQVDPSWDQTPRQLKRILSVAVEAAAEASGVVGGNLDDALDALALEVEVAMDRDDSLGGKAAKSILTSTEIEFPTDGERVLGAVRLVYEVTYYTDAPNEDDIERDAFLAAGVEYNQGGEQHTNDAAHDELAPEQ